MDIRVLKEILENRGLLFPYDENVIIRYATKGEWIDIKLAKPQGADHVLVTLKWDEDDYEVTELDYWVDVRSGGRLARHVTAWMPMPEPYKS